MPLHSLSNKYISKKKTIKKKRKKNKKDISKPKKVFQTGGAYSPVPAPRPTPRGRRSHCH